MLPVTERIQFEYIPSPYFLDSTAEKRQVAIEITRERDKATVTVLEDDLQAHNNQVAKDYHSIAIQIFANHLADYALYSITWLKHDIRDDEGYERTYNVKMDWDGDRYWNPTFEIEQTLDNFTVCGLAYTDTEMVLGIGHYHNQRQIRLPLERFPEIKALPLEQRRCVTTHKHGTVLYFYTLKAKLVLRDAIVLGRGLEFLPPGMNETEFLYGKRS